MITKEQKRRLSIFVILSTIILGSILFMLIYPKLKGKGEIYIIDFKNKSVNGLNKGSDVKYQGVKVGKVDDIEVNKDDLSSILVYIELKNGFPVKKDMTATLQYAGITGLKYIEIEGGMSSSEELYPGSKINVGKGFGEKAENIVKNIDMAIKNVNKLIGDKNEKKIKGLLENLEKSSGIVKTVLGSKRETVSNALNNIEKASNKITNVVEDLNRFTKKLNSLTDQLDIKKITENFNKMVVNISDRFSRKELGKVLANIDLMVKATTTGVKKLDMSVQKIENNFSRAMENLRESLDNITKFTRDIAEDPTSLLLKKNRSRRK